MKDELPYEELIAWKFVDLPLPDEDMAWDDMRRRLEEDRNRRFIPFWLNGCLGWGLTGMLAIGLSWWILKPLKWFRGSDDAEIVSVEKSVNNNLPSNQPDGSTVPVSPVNPGRTGHSPENDPGKTSSGDENSIAEKDTKSGPGNPGVDRKKENEDAVGKTGTIGKISPGKTGKYSRNKETRKVTGNTAKVKTVKKPVENKPVQPARKGLPDESLPADNKDNGNNPVTEKPVIPSTDNDTAGSKFVVVPDSVTKKKDSAIVETSTPDTANNSKDANKKVKRSFTISVGTGMYQQLPIAGQSLVPYNAWGRNGTLMDYIPSFILRLNREEKWFFQSEFRYGAPQYTKKELYKQQLDTNHITQKVNINSSRLRKTYYHQVPLTFNYYVAKGFSIGAGVSWNRFSSAISENELVQRDLGTGLDTVLLSPQVFRIRRPDSNFVKSFWQAIFESSYHRKKFSVGLRYSFGLQPYIRFDLPGIPGQALKNSSFQLFIRYELWRSRKKEKSPGNP